MRYAFIAGHAQEYSVTVLCQAMEVSVSGYYAWRTRGVSQREHADRMRHEVGLPAGQQIGLELVLAAHGGRRLAPAQHLQHPLRLELGRKLSSCAHAATFLLDTSYPKPPVQDWGRTTQPAISIRTQVSAVGYDVVAYASAERIRGQAHRYARARECRPEYDDYS